MEERDKPRDPNATSADSDWSIEAIPERFEDGAPPSSRRRGGWIGWTLWVLTLIGIVAWGFLQAYPFWRDARALRDEHANNLETLEKLRGAALSSAETIAELRERNAELEKDVETKAAALAKVQEVQEELAAKLAQEIKRGEVLVSQRRGVLVVDLVNKILFDSGKAELNERGKRVLTRVSESLLKIPDKLIQVAGHTDALPISDKLVDRFATNWELSAARATHVVRFLQEECKVPGKRLMASGHSHYRPVASNRTSVGRRKNRRIEVSLLPVPR